VTPLPIEGYRGSRGSAVQRCRCLGHGQPMDDGQGWRGQFAGD
jgi:hypothetical protein